MFEEKVICDKKRDVWWFLVKLKYKSGATSGTTIKIAKNEAKKVNKNNALVAQLDRALDYESRGQGFESSRAHHHLNLSNWFLSIFCETNDWCERLSEINATLTTKKF